MKIISKNAELIILLIIIFFIFFTLTVMYENKISNLKSDISKSNNCINANNIYFTANTGNVYEVNITFLNMIIDGYVRLSYNDEIIVLETSSTLFNNLVSNMNYTIVIENSSGLNIIKNDLQKLISSNQIISIEQEV